MANMKITDYTQVIDLGGNEFLLISQDGVYKKVTLDQIRNLATDIANTELADLVGKVASATDIKNILATINTSLSDLANKSCINNKNAFGYTSILAWANANSQNITAQKIAAETALSDIPTSVASGAEMILELIVGQGGRKFVRLVTFGDTMRLFYRNIFSNAWYNNWKEIGQLDSPAFTGVATLGGYNISNVKRTTVIATPGANMTIARQNIYIENKTLYLEVMVGKTDATLFDATTLKLFSIPTTGLVYHRTIEHTHWSDYSILVNGSGTASLLSTGECFIINAITGSKYISVSAVIALEGV